MPIDKPLAPRARLQARDLPGTVGVYELADEAGEVIYIGYAGGRSLFGLRGVLAEHFSSAEPNPTIRERAKAYRYEITTNYLIRRLELLSRFNEDYGRLPAGNEASSEALPPLTRYGWRSPATS
jgi:hypothetical protein